MHQFFDEKFVHFVDIHAGKGPANNHIGHFTIYSKNVNENKNLETLLLFLL
jgi:hypothetical protein